MYELSKMKNIYIWRLYESISNTYKWAFSYNCMYWSKTADTNIIWSQFDKLSENSSRQLPLIEAIHYAVDC